ncbi:methyltransferase, FxLD system [Actinokineospora sp. UTMC 2448]|uniref:methyltransferase, FxLD system n=1 Tax=Actinokineospora sp. UTMC 2448 TaxID=2268449 RepID=UPI0021641AB3|nr:methyltransferase, FxLD system [Actinokineospora sp. UTMC 2448]UVS80489.1 Protein-L-isoaspartate O-methyltransferase [Actinokineospora sp. UTMC 2448]
MIGHGIGGGCAIETHDISDELKAAMVSRLRELKALRTEPVERAFLKVPRHKFTPGVPLDSAYDASQSVVVRRDADDAVVSTVSAPAIQAMMLEQAALRPGMRVLEIGSGGYNAALIAEMVGAEGAVVSIDIDPVVVDRARRFLDDTGYDTVRVLLGDAENGVPGVFDRVIVTAGAWDIPPAWWNLLAENGRIVVPVRLRGMTRVVALEKTQGVLVDRGHAQAGFVAMQGAGAHEDAFVSLWGDEEAGLRIEGAIDVDPAALAEALSQPRFPVWSGVTVTGEEPFDDLDLYLATHTDRFGTLVALRSAVEAKLVSRWALWGAPACYSVHGLAYRVTRKVPDTGRFELGVFAHGGDAAVLGDQWVRLIRQWDRAHRHGPGARISVYPASTPVDRVTPGFALVRDHSRFVVSWPTRTEGERPG